MGVILLTFFIVIILPGKKIALSTGTYFKSHVPRSERVVLRAMYLATGLWVGAGVALDILWKWYQGQHLLETSRMLDHLYLGGMKALDHISESNSSAVFAGVTLAIDVVLHVITFIIKRIK